ncbi:MAG: phosphonate ABC transporter, permease protein PhnE [Bdellovibrionaceae bacterium]|nr:phosphonate ABC transporter, permease protein PhnE [Pseudobdellovibrionaceae bacterium]
MQKKSMGPVVRRTVFDAFVFAYLVMAVLSPIIFSTEEALHQLSRNASIFFGLSIVGAFISGLVSRAGVRTLGEILFAPAHKRLPQGEPKPWYATLWGQQALVTTLVTLIVGLIVTEASIVALLDKERITSASRLLGELFNPGWHILPTVIVHMVQTVYMAFVATLIAVPIAFVLSFMAAKNIMGTTGPGMAFYTALRVVLNVSRSIEPIVWAIIFALWVGFGPFAGMLALMIQSVSSLAKQYSEYVEGVDEGPIEGIRSTGATTLQTVWFAIVPQVTLPYISYTIYRWDTNVRMATIIGFVGGGGIGKLLIEYQLQGAWREVGCILLVIAAVVWIMDAFSAYVREAIK